MKMEFKENLSDQELFKMVLDAILTETLSNNMGVNAVGIKRCNMGNFWVAARHLSVEFQQRLFMVLRGDQLMALIEEQPYRVSGRYVIRRDKLREAARICSKHWPLRLPEEGMIPVTIDDHGVVHATIDGEPAAEIDTDLDLDDIDHTYVKALWGLVGIAMIGLVYFFTTI